MQRGAGIGIELNFQPRIGDGITFSLADCIRCITRDSHEAEIGKHRSRSRVYYRWILLRGRVGYWVRWANKGFGDVLALENQEPKAGERIAARSAGGLNSIAVPI